jgi:mRNA interferase MazF
MIRGELYRVANLSAGGPKKFRVFVIVSRRILIDSKFSTVICAAVYKVYDGSLRVENLLLVIPNRKN